MAGQHDWAGMQASPSGQGMKAVESVLQEHCCFCKNSNWRSRNVLTEN